MIDRVRQEIVRKYAHALVNIFSDRLTQEHIMACEQAAQFLRTHRRALFLLRVPLVPIEVKRKGLAEFIDRFSLPVCFLGLVDLLLRDNRAYLLAEILDQIKDIYYKENAIHIFNIMSSHTLQNIRYDEIKRFIEGHVPGTSMYTYTVDKKLIAGVRLQSDTFLWEHSIDKQLRDILLSGRQ